MRVAFCLALLLSTPAIAATYTVTRDTASVNSRDSIFGEIEFPASSFSEIDQQSSGSFSSEISTFELKDMDEETRLKTETTLSDLGARQERGQIVVDLPSDVLFDFDKADIRTDARPVLAKLSDVLKVMEKSNVSVIGHTDAKGSDTYNDRLSERRAASVKKHLSDLGVISSMTTEGKGERVPIAPNQHSNGADDPDGRQKNRRVQIIIGEN